MARPTGDESALLECVDGVSALLASMSISAELLEIHLRDAGRRVYGSPTMDSISTARDELREMVVKLHQARSLAREWEKLLLRRRA